MNDESRKISRREFAALSLAAGASAATGMSTVHAAASAPEGVTDSDVQIQTASGVCDAALLHPAHGGRRPGVILFADAFGLRPIMRDMAKRLAADGYTVLVPNPYYRTTRAPGIDRGFDFTNPTDRAKLDALRAPLTSEAVMQDAVAYVKFLESQPIVDRHAAMGVFGYCMGGAMTLQAAAAAPERIGAVASFHGGGLVADKPGSPHLLIPKTRARYYVAIAANDDQRQPDAKLQLDETFRAAHRPAKIEVYAATLHGWCVKDMPLQAGKPIYDEPQAERAWNELITLYRQAGLANRARV
jgi:carboxymethylenebutenolidase